ncbi:SDR family NAD(P)-dependent oxidoreductase, partial [Actinophytocola sp.]|uniref:SDR family NAD(P)-dependent oxidoreductase n=1 Tax=Actinophytocola sp. TaxID=1872138 RepID=UPI002D80A599
AEHPLTAVVHTAGVLADGTIESLTPRQVDTVLRPKVDGAWNLHELTRDLPLSAFVLFSSIVGTAGMAGQANYAAANAFLDALAHHRRARALPATSLAWSLWAQTGGMAGGLDEANLGRWNRSGLARLHQEQGLALFDTALTVRTPVVVPARLDLAALRTQAVAGMLPAVFRGLVKVSSRRTVEAGAAESAPLWAQRTANLPADERERAVRDLVHTAVATVLGHSTPATIDADRAFTALGLDSLTGVELRNWLNGATGLRLPATVAFDHPSPAALAGYLQDELVDLAGEPPAAPVAEPPAAPPPPVAVEPTPDHPLLGPPEEFDDLEMADMVVFTSRLSLRTHPWLADHLINETVLLSGAAFAELAVLAGAHGGCAYLDELTMEAPLAVPEHSAVQLQLIMWGPEDSGRRSVVIQSRPDNAAGVEGEPPWTQHATGVVAPAPDPVGAPGGAGTWPPAGATAIGLADAYLRLSEQGYGYGPVFQGLRQAWRLGEDVYAEVAQPSDADTAGFGLHPAVLDAALHPELLRVLDDDQFTGRLRLPFSWTGLRLYATTAATLRVHLSRTGPHAVRVAITDPDGSPVATVGSVVLRQISTEQIADAGATHDESLFDLSWIDVLTNSARVATQDRWALVGPGPVTPETLTLKGIRVESYPDLRALSDAITWSNAVPQVVLLSCPPGGADVLTEARLTLARVLAEAQAFLADTRLGSARLVVVTTGAVVADPDDDLDLSQVPVWGLVRSAQSENPDRFVLLDLDGREASRLAVPAAVACGEPQIAVRDGRVKASRLVRAEIPETEGGTAPELVRPNGTVLITGATGSLGRLASRHLVTRYGARHLLLVSRTGAHAAGARELAADLAARGAKVRFAACDVGDRAALADLLASIPAEHPLTGVLHAAGVLDDGIIESLTPLRLDAVLRPKVDAAWHLHELTSGLDLSMFVLYSSAAGALGTAGQGNFAAANAFLPALVAHRRALGLPATSLTFGRWRDARAVSDRPAAADPPRANQSGIGAISAERGFALFDAAVKANRAFVAPGRLDTAALRVLAGSGMVPSIFRGLVRTPPRPEPADGTLPWAARLAGLPESERRRRLLELIRLHVVAVLGHIAPNTIAPHDDFTELGFDSLAGVELRNRLDTTTGLHLPATLVFDYPTPGALAQHLLTCLGLAAVTDEDDEIRKALATVPVHRLRQAGLLDELLRLAREPD